MYSHNYTQCNNEIEPVSDITSNTHTSKTSPPVDDNQSSITVIEYELEFTVLRLSNSLSCSKLYLINITNIVERSLIFNS